MYIVWFDFKGQTVWTEGMNIELFLFLFLLYNHDHFVSRNIGL